MNLPSQRTHLLSSLPRRLAGFFRFAACFARELVLANLSVARTVLLQPRSALTPGFVSYPLGDLSSFEIILLTHCITLTPGTASVEIDEKHRTLLVHALDARDPAGLVRSIHETLEAPLLRWTR